jgi:hypothetical protein
MEVMEMICAYARAAVEQASEGDVVGTIHGYQKGTARPMVRWNRRPGDAGTPLYTRPQPSAGDAVAWIEPYHLGALRKRRDNKEAGYILVEVCDSETEDYCVPLYTHPPAAAVGQAERKPDGYAYRYSDAWGSGRTVIEFNGGQERNGNKPLEAIPYYFGTPPAAAAAKDTP